VVEFAVPSPTRLQSSYWLQLRDKHAPPVDMRPVAGADASYRRRCSMRHRPRHTGRPIDRAGQCVCLLLRLQLPRTRVLYSVGDQPCTSLNGTDASLYTSTALTTHPHQLQTPLKRIFHQHATYHRRIDMHADRPYTLSSIVGISSVSSQPSASTETPVFGRSASTCYRTVVQSRPVATCPQHTT
jgi:hypothetical protein